MTTINKSMKWTISRSLFIKCPQRLSKGYSRHLCLTYTLVEYAPRGVETVSPLYKGEDIVSTSRESLEQFMRERI